MGNTGAAIRRSSVVSKMGSLGRRGSRQTAESLEEPAGLSSNHKAALVKTWRIIEDDIARVGVITFIGLFETHPDIQKVFKTFRGVPIDELKQNKQLRAHAIRVMAFVQKAIGRLNEPEKLEQMIQELGKKHHGYGAKTKYVDLVGPQFMIAIKPSLGKDWNEETEEAWTLLFAKISYVMKITIMEEEVKL